jgi:hypothetical protein
MAVTCFSEAQLLSFLADLESDRALIWYGTDPNTQRKNECFIFPILTRATYGTRIKKDGSLKMLPGKVVMRLFTNVRDISIQIESFKL